MSRQECLISLRCDSQQRCEPRHGEHGRPSRGCPYTKATRRGAAVGGDDAADQAGSATRAMANAQKVGLDVLVAERPTGLNVSPLVDDLEIHPAPRRPHPKTEVHFPPISPAPFCEPFDSAVHVPTVSIKPPSRPWTFIQIVQGLNGY